MSIKVRGDKALLRNLAQLDEDADQAVRNGVKVTAQQIANYAINTIDEQSQGAKVVRTSGGQRRNHIASKKGDAPNTDTGRLVGSISVTMDVSEPIGFVFTDLDYGLYLEKVLNRPWLNPALEANIDKLEQNVVDQMRKITGDE